MELTLYARMDAAVNITCDFFNFTQDDPVMAAETCNRYPEPAKAVRPRPEALLMAERLREGCANVSVGPMSCVFFPANCQDDFLSGKCSRSTVLAASSNRSYEPLMRAHNHVHLELIGPELNDRNKLKLFLDFITDNADDISRGMRGSMLSFFGTCYHGMGTSEKCLERGYSRTRRESNVYGKKERREGDRTNR